MSITGKTNYTEDDYNWVRKQISLHHPRGISRREIEEISQRESKRLGLRPRSEKPPGRDKIIQILKAGIGVNWDYNKSKGGRGNKSEYIARTQDPTVLSEKTIHFVAYEELAARLNTLYRKREAKFERMDYFEFVRIRNQLLSYPMKVFHYGTREKGLDKKVMFNSLIRSVLVQLEKIKKIEKSQTRLDKNFVEIIKNTDKLNDSGIDQVIVDPNSNIKEYVTTRNALRRLLKIKT
jgi:hypothetical protein